MHRFYGMESAPDDVLELYNDLLALWSPETCAPRLRSQWSQENPTKGQCSVTAFLVQDLLGGEVLGVKLSDGNYHCFNVLESGVFDLTSEQFSGRQLSYAGAVPQTREAHFAKEEKYRRYLLLKTKLKWRRLVNEVVASGPYRADWESLSQHPVPVWFRRDKLGAFIHWGVYSVPAWGNEWYPRSMYDPASPEFEHHRSVYGDQKTFGYKDFIPSFRAEKFDPDAWAALFADAGIRYVTPVAEHHDGFAMYPTDFNPFNAAEMGPCRDVVGELKAACERRGLTFCASTHRAEHYFFLNMGRTFDSDIGDERYYALYGPAVYAPEFDARVLHITTEDPRSLPPYAAWLEDWTLRTCELVDRYRPSLLYFDWWVHNRAFKPYLKRIAAFYYNRAVQWEKEVTITYKHEAFPPGVAVFDVERGALTDISPVPWQTDTAIGKLSWGYRADNEYKSARQVICDLVDIVSKNGNLMINIGPKPDGTLTEEETRVLTTLGKWMAVNGDGICGTTCWRIFGEGTVNAEAGFFKDNDEKPFTDRDFRFTCKNGALYAFQMSPAKTVKIRSLAKRKEHDFLIESVSSPSVPIENWTRTEEGLEISLRDLPAGALEGLPVCFRITFE